MNAPRLLPLALLIALCAATAVAQSPSDKSHDSSQLLPALKDSAVAPQPDSLTPHVLTLEQNQATCYTLRTYRVARENPDSDATRPAGYSTCRRAARFQLWTAVDSPKSEPR